MRCPHCDIASLEGRQRDGVTIHVCCGCRGIWLEKAELRELVARFTREREAYQQLAAHGCFERPGADGRPLPASWFWFDTLEELVH
jgi:Zn-finger nucleic acid-binding protein